MLPLSCSPVSRLHSLFLGLTLSLYGAELLAAAEAAGKVLTASDGFYALQADGQKRLLQRRSDFLNGDTLVTGSNMRAQLRFTDGSLIALRENTRFKVSDYQYQAKPDDRHIGELLEGGVRSITGKIAHDQPEAYQIRTKVATIGVRGTTLEAVWANQQLVVAAWQGRVFVQGRGGILDLGEHANYNFALVGEDGTPQGLLQAPALLQQSTRLQGGRQSPGTTLTGMSNDSTPLISSGLLPISGSVLPAVRIQDGLSSDSPLSDADCRRAGCDRPVTGSNPPTDPSPVDPDPVDPDPVDPEPTKPSFELSADEQAYRSSHQQLGVIVGSPQTQTNTDGSQTLSDHRSLQGRATQSAQTDGSLQPVFVESQQGGAALLAGTPDILDQSINRVVRQGNASSQSSQLSLYDLQYGSWQGTASAPIQIFNDANQPELYNAYSGSAYWLYANAAGLSQMSRAQGSRLFSIQQILPGTGSGGSPTRQSGYALMNLSWDGQQVAGDLSGQLSIQNAQDLVDIDFTAKLDSASQGVSLKFDQLSAQDPRTQQSYHARLDALMVGNQAQAIAGSYSLGELQTQHYLYGLFLFEPYQDASTGPVLTETLSQSAIAVSMRPASFDQILGQSPAGNQLPLLHYAGGQSGSSLWRPAMAIAGRTSQTGQAADNSLISWGTWTTSSQDQQLPYLRYDGDKASFSTEAFWWIQGTRHTGQFSGQKIYQLQGSQSGLQGQLYRNGQYQSINSQDNEALLKLYIDFSASQPSLQAMLSVETAPGDNWYLQAEGELSQNGFDLALSPDSHHNQQAGLYGRWTGILNPTGQIYGGLNAWSYNQSQPSYLSGVYVVDAAVASRFADFRLSDAESLSLLQQTKFGFSSLTGSSLAQISHDANQQPLFVYKANANPNQNLPELWLQPVESVLRQGGAQISSQSLNLFDLDSSGQLVNSYVEWGEWLQGPGQSQWYQDAQNPAQAQNLSQPLLYVWTDQATPVSAMPRTGQKIYQPDILATTNLQQQLSSSALQIDVDFGTQQAQGKLELSFSDAAGNLSQQWQLPMQGQLTANQLQLSTQTGNLITSSQQTTASGQLHGLFIGPNAGELIGNFEAISNQTTGTKPQVQGILLPAGALSTGQ